MVAIGTTISGSISPWWRYPFRNEFPAKSTARDRVVNRPVRGRTTGANRRRKIIGIAVGAAFGMRPDARLAVSVPSILVTPQYLLILGL
jgi:hypothetical protein